jgi:hypothetical protein
MMLSRLASFSATRAYPRRQEVGPKSGNRSRTIDNARVRTLAGSPWLLGLLRDVWKAGS